MTSTLVENIPGYSISEKLYNGSRTQVYRGYRKFDRQPVVVKLLKNPYPSFNELLLFRNQYTIAKNLNSPLIVQTYSLEPCQNGYALVMEDFGAISLKEWATRETQQSLEEFLEIAIALCNILDLLYHERIIHKDIKPSNILINPNTKQVKLIDFSIASLLPRETPTLVNPNVLEGTLGYISPEQTGRMNRGIDYRTDFYSLGVTFYELLTGELPFASHDAMELVHSHVAKIAPLVHEINSEISSVLSKIVSKLMAKNAEDRYQSALGIKLDLENCLHQLQVLGKIESFEIAQRDMCDRFTIPEKLYGREAEVQTLLEAFGRIANGASELMLVAGFSGIGKTAVVNEVHKPIVLWNGYFIKGKFDQFNRNIPLSAFVQALRDLMGQLLSESDEQLVQWKDKILTAVGENGQVLVDVIPELEQIIGKQPPAPELSGSVAQNRFNLLFQKFIAVFATQKHPLVMFLDDLQWADSASLSLMQVLMNQSDRGYLLMIGAYRDNEVFPAHPLMLTLEEMRQAQSTLSTLTLTPLSQSDITHLIADTLSCSIPTALPLSELVYQKTQGNPFFTTQFLKALHQEGYIAYNFNVGHWQCDIVAVRSLSLTDDVVEFIALQLQKLPAETQRMLKLAACVGAQFNLETLAIISEQSSTDAATALWKALQEGLILPTSQIYKFFQCANLSETQEAANPTYRFLHDRVQQAAYALIPERQKQATHLQIGRLLLKNTASDAIESNVFDIVNQLNKGTDPIAQSTQCNELAQLNLVAGRKAKASTAYKSAVQYLKTGLELLPATGWQEHYPLAFALHRERADCEYLIGNFEQAEHLFGLALTQAKTIFERAEIYGGLMTLRLTQGEDIDSSIAAGLEGLSALGIALPNEAEALRTLVQAELEKMQTTLAALPLQTLLEQPPMTDPVQQARMKLVGVLWSVAYVAGKRDLAFAISLFMVNLSLNHGVTDSSGFAYGIYGVTLASQGNYRAAYEFGQVGLALDRQMNAVPFIAKNNNHFGHFINPYAQPLKTNLPLYQESLRICQETGDLVFGVWAVVFIIWTLLIKGDPLHEVYAETEKYLSYVERTNDPHMLYAFTLKRQFLRHLQGSTEPTDLLDQALEGQPAPYIDIWRQKQIVPHGVNWYGLLKLQLLYLYGRYAEALETIAEIEQTRNATMDFFSIAQYHFYYPLSLAALYATATAETKIQYWSILQRQQQILKQNADECPANFLHRYLLLSAEMAHLNSNYAEAIDCYDRAIASATANEYIHETALANELAAKFYLNWGKERIAQDYLIEAYYGYARWGAKAKVADLETHYPQLLAPILQQTRTPLSVNETVFASGIVASSISSTSVSDSLDLAAILKASQTLSSEIELDKLLASLLKIVIEGAGANRCVLMLLRDNHLLIKGAIMAEAEPVVLQQLPIEESQDIPLKLIYKVKHEQKTVVLADASADPILANDLYIARQQPRSILCSPILHQGKLMGILYLENSSVIGAFTTNRVELLNLLCTQAAISLENARLYECSLESLSELHTAQSRFHNLVDNVPGVVYQYSMSADGILSLNYISADCYSLYEITPEQAVADPNFLDKMIHPDDVASYLQTYADTVQTRSPWCWEGRIVTPSGIVKWVHGESRVEQRADNSLVWDGLFLDISDRKQAELGLQQAQLQIIQSEKMSALGNLVAGVAHEMNNPLGFIAASIQETKPTIADITEHLKLYQKAFPNKSEEIEDHAEEIDLDYTLEDLPKMLDSMTMACNRLKNISTSLRTFSRADRDYKVPFNIHEGIDSTILILKHRLKANEQRPAIDVITNYGDLPLVNCFPGQLNQVFMNILANAIDALEEASIGKSFAEIQAHPNSIKITTSIVDNTHVKVSITDNGQGMSAAVQAKIFDHLFTTKSVGKGTGLGLAIARQIVEEKHNGKITVNSVLGEGTEFIISLPI
ncbi:histidine kinase [[Phormidium ambiguum] IAM M-71]|uniref:histidine kinase n=1 Tax=[Phormidium ambiguum] IAM M-71 TaxID=454136 RepID=A0A1U7I8E0_9CYAN|nr:ATP-binding sensor histidine kinase [Phormidium ambiguum]OKH32648.1 histidine kinase [Phormidium ambiguum IAM M-71]